MMIYSRQKGAPFIPLAVAQELEDVVEHVSIESFASLATHEKHILGAI